MRLYLFPLIVAGLVVTGCSRAPELSPARGYFRTVLAVQQQQQEPMLCVPTSAAMVMAFYGDLHSPREIKTLSVGRPYDPAAPFNDFTLTYYDDAVRAAVALGYVWAQRSFADDDEGFEEGLALIEDQLRAGHPVLVDATLPSGHTFVIRGFDLGSRQLFAVDPDRPPPGINNIPFEEFKDIWNEHAYGNKTRVMIITQPKY